MGLWARDSATVAGTQFSTLAVTTVLGILVARYLGPSEFGIFAGFLGLAQVATLVAGVGIPTWLLRELSNALASQQEAEHAVASRNLSAALALVGSLSAFLTLVALSAGHLLVSGNLALALGALMGYMGLLSCSTILEIVFRAHRRLSRVVVATFLEKLSLLAIVVAATVIEAGIVGIALGYVAAGLLRLSWDLYTIRTGDMTPLSRPSVADVRMVIRGALPFGLGSTIPSGIARLDFFLIGLVSTSTAGFYAVADRFVSVLLIIPVAGAYALYPHLAGRQDAVRATWRMARLLALLGVVLAGIAIFLADSAVPLLFGSRYEAAAPGLRIMLLATPFLFAVNILVAGLFSGGHERRVLVVMLVAAGSGSVLVVAGGALFGLQGAAAGYMLRSILSLLGLAALSRSLRPPSRLTPDRPAALAHAEPIVPSERLRLKQRSAD